MRIRGMALLLAALLFPFSTLALDEEETYLAPMPKPVTFMVTSPSNGQTWEKGEKLTFRANYEGIDEIEAVLRFPDGEEIVFRQAGKEQLAGGSVEHTFVPGDTQNGHFTTEAVLTVCAKTESGDEVTKTIRIISPKDRLIEQMFAEALANSKDKRYRYAPAQEDWHVGVCKNFVMRLFDTFSSEYRMAQYPDLKLYMPKNKSKKDSAPYDYGIEWRPEGPADGAPFEVAAQFKYDASLSKAENMAKCRQVLYSVQRGDFFQMVGYYYYGNGPHSLLFMEDYEPKTDNVHWTDSNMKGDRVDGVRWGYIQYDAVKTAEWFVEAICTKNRGCTIYRLRDDLFIP